MWMRYLNALVNDMQIDWLPQKLLNTSGKLGLTHMPGYHRPLGADLDSLKGKGVHQIVCLQESREFQYSRIAERDNERQLAIQARGMKFLHEPIRDFDIPSLSQATHLVDEINAGLAQGDGIAMHCFAGLGRTGTIASCVLVSQGYGADEAVKLLRKYRRGSVQTEEQYEFVRSFAQSISPQL